MGKKLLALALLGAVAYLFRTKKGNELRKQAADSASKAVDQLRVKFRHANGQPVKAMHASI